MSLQIPSQNAVSPGTLVYSITIDTKLCSLGVKAIWFSLFEATTIREGDSSRQTEIIIDEGYHHFNAHARSREPVARHFSLKIPGGLRTILDGDI
ncbi:MAG: hypothetical protein V2I33_24815, partial [Kangiellaceae bacterium]|nr:hypothetical protein [Kangiellaceae bacterium]